jgi:RNA polymerase sigma factor (sigma-70 family)
MIGAEEIIDLYDLHARELLGFFVRRTGDPQVALDLLSDTFLAAFEHRRSCRGPSEAERTAWLFRIAANKLAAHFRRRSSERRAAGRLAGELRALTQDELVVIQQLAQASDRSQTVIAAFNGLSADQREAIRMHVIDEQPYRAVSGELGISEPAVRARVSRGLRAMRRAIARDPERNPK